MSELHRCNAYPKNEFHAMYGVAIAWCKENEKGELWCDNEEYATRVNFCPFCGYKAPRVMPDVDQ